MSQQGVRFGPGAMVSPGEYRNIETGAVRYFDGTTPLPGGPNAASWQQVSDHYHAEGHGPGGRSMPEGVTHDVRFPPGAMVSPGEYRNVETGTVRYFDGTTPLPGSVNSASWQQVSDHYHAEGHSADARDAPEPVTHEVRFPPGAMVSPGEYRNVETGAVRYFDGKTPLPGGVNASSWQQISDHYHPEA
jgi:hypothetical protein